MQLHDTGTYQSEQTREATTRLLDLLCAEHDYNMKPPENWKPRKRWHVGLPAPRAKEWFKPAIDGEKPEPKINDILCAAAQYFNVSKLDLLSARRTLDLTYPRHVAMYYAKNFTKKSLPEIGRRMGGRDHTTILYGVRKIAGKIKTDWKIAYDVAQLEAML